ncbi:acyltransferase [Vibrio sp. IRLE0018]|uniref:acyltransferase n=1 Tax=Vibrio floridensis TaxID=2908007 RepID=UPI001F45E991|nr:acyltransferase [Vibrio floridensis]MCF8780031.1 acyltransferase [Vibrio floridensis]
MLVKNRTELKSNRYLARNDLKSWLKHHRHPALRGLFQFLKRARSANLPTPYWFNLLLYRFVVGLRNLGEFLLRTFVTTPAFKGRVKHCGNQLYLYGGLPLVTDNVAICIGDACNISGQSTITGCSSVRNPTLNIGSRVSIGWQTTIAVGDLVSIEDDVAIAGRCMFFGYSGHPLDPKRRAAGEGDDPAQIRPITLKRGCWIGSNVTIMAGVTIGEGSVIAAGSVVTQTIPEGVIAGGNPARVIRSISANAQSRFSTLKTAEEQEIHNKKGERDE